MIKAKVTLIDINNQTVYINDVQVNDEGYITYDLEAIWKKPIARITIEWQNQKK